MKVSPTGFCGSYLHSVLVGYVRGTLVGLFLGICYQYAIALSFVRPYRLLLKGVMPISEVTLHPGMQRLTEK
jgi:hypothetical protein